VSEINYEERNKAVLEDFAAYCRRRPEMRFWQALASWSEGTVLLLQNLPEGQLITDLIDREPWLKDTYHWEGKNG
jgi:hypothetical protein